ncbi:LysE family translocator [Rhodovulum euryhalinum]|uniref:Threonine/homoserine/homoserine lactone efflux protein n=1 Tax=Rhodovulum euryhalinum TaxID=35805 RepID=A0A4R2KJS2_9RHOB|nr:LysE family translocator [Rhodovulum euryhalinum]TCO73544.1 threonine/homoserine/homoserine lactone efflux protein [Rhodovulum euryhalinum]
MTVTPGELLLYAGALFVLFLTPGPVWVALTARALSGGFRAAWPLALGVVIGDVLWPLLAILGVSWVVATFDGFLVVLRYVASLVFLVMGVLLIRHADATIAADSRLTRPGMWAGFLAGLAAILGNPKAILFYMGVLPGFFDLAQVGGPDIAAIVAISMVVPLAGNLVFALFIDRARRILTSPAALRRTNRVAGLLLILVGLVIPFT